MKRLLGIMAVLACATANVVHGQVEFNSAVPGSIGVCYASTGEASGAKLLTIDMMTGAATSIGGTGLFRVAGLAINSGGFIYGTENVFLYEIDAATAATTLVGNIDAVCFFESSCCYSIETHP